MQKVIAGILLLLVCAASFAQQQQQPNSNPLDRSKTGDFYMRMADEVRSRKSIDSAHVALHTAGFRDALHAFAPGSANELRVSWGEFVTANGTVFVALQLTPPTAISTDKKAVVFGEIVDASGRAILDFEEPAKLVASKRDVVLDRTLFVPSGSVGTFGIAVGGEVAGIGRAAINYDEVKPNGPGVSRLLVSDDVYNLTIKQDPFLPFAFGGTKVVPKFTFRRSDEVWLFTDVRNPSVDEKQTPKLTMKWALEGNGKKLAPPATAADALPLKGVAGHFGVGTTIDVSRLTPGDYDIHFTLVDELAKQTYQRDAKIRIIE